MLAAVARLRCAAAAGALSSSGRTCYPALPGLALIVAGRILSVLVYIGALRLISPKEYRSIRDVVARGRRRRPSLARRLVSASLKKSGVPRRLIFTRRRHVATPKRPVAAHPRRGHHVDVTAATSGRYCRHGGRSPRLTPPPVERAKLHVFLSCEHEEKRASFHWSCWRQTLLNLRAPDIVQSWCAESSVALSCGEGSGWCRARWCGCR